MSSNVAPIPWYVPVVQLDPNTQKPMPGYGMSKEWGNWFQTSIISTVANAPSFYPSVALTGQNASIATTPIPLPTLATGTYRLTYYARITTADPVSSSLTVAFSWTEGSVTPTISGTAITGNTTTTVQTGTLTIAIDASTSISYATTYVSNTPGAMAYRLTILTEAV